MQEQRVSPFRLLEQIEDLLRKEGAGGLPKVDALLRGIKKTEGDDNTQKYNIAPGGGPGIGKSTLALGLCNTLNTANYDYDMIVEFSRGLKKLTGGFKSAEDRYTYLALQRVFESGSSASCGFVTDTPVFKSYISAFYYNTGKYAKNATDESLQTLDQMKPLVIAMSKGWYQLIPLVKDPFRDFGFKNDNARGCTKEDAIAMNALTIDFVEEHLPGCALYVKGQSGDRIVEVFGHIMQEERVRLLAAKSPKYRAELGRSVNKKG